MIVAMQEVASEHQIQRVRECLISMGFKVHRSAGVQQTLLGVGGDGPDVDIRDIEVFPGVREVQTISSRYKLASRMFGRREQWSRFRTA